MFKLMPDDEDLVSVSIFVIAIFAIFKFLNQTILDQSMRGCGDQKCLRHKILH